MDDIRQNGRFDFLRYANCWEDADILLKALQVQSTDRCLSIASGGDNSLSLLSEGPSEVVAFDINSAQLACMELKVAAIKLFEYDDLLDFLGVTQCRKRLTLYDKLKEHLSNQCRAFIDGQRDALETGIIHWGKFERYFSIIRRRMLPLLYTKKTLKELLQQKNLEARMNFYQNVVEQSSLAVVIQGLFQPQSDGLAWSRSFLFQLCGRKCG